LQFTVIEMWRRIYSIKTKIGANTNIKNAKGIRRKKMLTRCFRIIILCLSLSFWFLIACYSTERASKQVNIVIKPLLPVKADNVRVIIQYYNPMKEPLIIPLPANNDEMHSFFPVEIKIDGKKPQFRYYNPILDDPYFSIRKTIQPGESFDLEVDLSLIYIFPQEWKKMEITHKSYALLEITLLGSVVIEIA